MLTPRGLLEAPKTFDIVIGDFGREAAIEYVRLMAAIEKRLIASFLNPEGREFFDEYRRIMFCVIGDVAFFKESAISRSAGDPGYLRDDILVGSEWSPMSEDFAGRVAVAVAQEAFAALGRGHRHLRVLLPCNGLYVLAKEVERLLRADAELTRLLERYQLSTLDVPTLTAAEIDFHTVPDAVVGHFMGRSQTAQRTNLLVLGTRGANAIYEQLSDPARVSVVPLQDGDYEVISKAVVASIGGDPDQIAHSREQLQRDLVEPCTARFPDLITVEACTDFRFGVGVSSLELFAEAMVKSHYRRAGTSHNS